MDEQGFEFRHAPEKRERPQFEPPPWEKEAFEELQRRRAQESTEEATQPTPDSDEQAEAREDVATAPEEPAVTDQAGRGGEGQEAPAPESCRQLDEGKVVEMMAGLAAEETPTAKGYHKVAVATGMGLIALGGMILMWGMAALVGSRQTGLIGQVGGVGLGMFGAFFIGMGAWLLYRTLKQRGVL